MLTKKQIEILEVFHDKLFNILTFKQIKKKSKQNSNNIIQLAIKKFISLNIIIQNKIGDILTYNLNLNNNLTLAYLNLINENKLVKAKLPLDILNKLENKIRKKTIFFILGIFGSFAKGKATKNSDLDVVVFVEDDNTKKEIIPLIETIKRRELQNIDYHIITTNEFRKMLSVEYENLGKQIYKNNFIYYGYIQYLKLLRGLKNE